MGVNELEHFTRFMDIIRSEVGQPIRKELVGSPDKIMAHAFPQKFDGRNCWVCVIFFPRLSPHAVCCVGRSWGVTRGEAVPTIGVPKLVFVRTHS